MTKKRWSLISLPLVRKKLSAWGKERYLELAVFNVLLAILVLLHSAGYFNPFWLISINTIIFIMLCVSIVLLGMRSTAMFAVSFLFFAFSGFMKALNVAVWAERTSIYVFQALFLGILMLLFENIFLYNAKK
ncbi:MAG: hypothetical protein UX13_C0023G0007 [Candidatus Woesebacteria bacterium GW2011_GWB1_45_5]|uniref:Uncharacterized protein n=1 Tax=Candidatus Woesebacteria bacterium GW2011_GWB1_45_5 TaxID=1618581 RepID=A0A0G1MPH0_9BACT|nr:MAG: hypothetical protein UX13_C0023G0007 [Candidatus Woesebacteria bacterium GW2011_GWB1_45_5]